MSDERGNSYEVEKEISKSPITPQFLNLCEFLETEPKNVLTDAFLQVDLQVQDIDSVFIRFISTQ